MLEHNQIHAELQLEEARYCASTAVTFTIYGKLAKAGDNALEVAAEQAKVALKTTPLFADDETLYWTENSKAFADAAFELDPERSDSRFGIVKGDQFQFFTIDPAFGIDRAESEGCFLSEGQEDEHGKMQNNR